MSSPGNPANRDDRSELRIRLLAPLPVAGLDTRGTLGAARGNALAGTLGELSREQDALAATLDVLVRSLPVVPLRAQTFFIARAFDLLALRDALGEAQRAAIDARREHLFADETLLADYVRGLYALARATADELATSLIEPRDAATAALSTSALLDRLDDLRVLHFDELVAPIREALGRDRGTRPGTHVATAIEALFDAADDLDLGLSTLAP